MPKKQQTKKRRVKKNIARGMAHIHSTFNNTIVTITDEAGNAISWSSAGALGFKGSRKSTPYAAQMAAEAAGKAAADHGMKTVAVEIKGTGPGSADNSTRRSAFPNVIPKWSGSGLISNFPNRLFSSIVFT